MIRPILAAALLLINVAAITDVLGSRQSVPGRIGWIAIILLLPFAGALLWAMIGRMKPRERAQRR
jgi:hypothetical protein